MNYFARLRLLFFGQQVLSKNTVSLCGTLVLTILTWGSFKSISIAETTKNIPQELAETIQAIETAANDKDLELVMKYYDPSFSNDDGLTPVSVKKALSKVWDDYSRLNYKTTINSWSQEREFLVAETETIITGLQQNRGEIVNLKSTIKSRQYFAEGKLIRQEILAEETLITKGERPPQVKVVVPETVKVGEKYNFDTIVLEPLDGGVLLGTALEERTSSNLYLRPSTLELEPLSAGGIYKVVTAPRLSDNHWLSAIVVRGDGITMVTRRVKIER